MSDYHGFRMDPAIVRADLFKRRSDGAQGKWYGTIELDMTGFWDDINPVDAVLKAWINRSPNAPNPEHGFFLVVVHPYHKAPYPVMIEV